MRYLILSSLLLISLGASAQKWQPGFFVDVKNNRMDGLIEPIPSGKGPIKDEGFIAFKENKNANEIKLSASDLKYFVAGKDSFVVAHPPMGQTWPNELDFVRVVLDEPLKLYAFRGGPGSSGGGSGLHVSPSFGVGLGGGGYGGGYGGGGVGISLGGGNGSGRQKMTYYFGATTAELTEVNAQNFEDVMTEIMGDEPDVVEQLRNHRFGLGNIDKLIAYFKQVQASHK